MRPLALVITLTVVLGAGCADEPREDPGLMRPATYVAVSLERDGRPVPFVAGTTPTVVVSGDGRLRIVAGCNTMTGSYAIEDDVLVVRSLETTGRGCDPDRQAQDDLLGALVTGRPRIVAGGAESGGPPGGTAPRALDDGTYRLTLREQEDARAELAGTRWLVVGLGAGDTQASPPLGLPTEPFVRLSDDGLLDGHDGCVPLAGTELSYRRAGETLRFTGELPSAGSCAASVRDELAAVLTGTVDLRLDGEHLTLTAADGRSVTFRAGED